MKSVILSVGGSLLIPGEGINVHFLNSFNQFIRSHIANTRFLLVVGGVVLHVSIKEPQKQSVVVLLQMMLIG